jgi:hypothetical protein
VTADEHPRRLAPPPEDARARHLAPGATLVVAALWAAVAPVAFAEDPAPTAADFRPLATGEWRRATDVDRGRLIRLAKANTGGEDLSKKNTHMINNVQSLIRGLAGIQFCRYLGEAESQPYRGWIGEATGVLESSYGFAKDSGANWSVREAAASVTKEFGVNRAIYETSLALLFFEHASAAGEPRGKVDLTKDRPPSVHPRAPEEDERGLVRTTCLLLVKSLGSADPEEKDGTAPFAWDEGPRSGAGLARDFRNDLWTYRGFGRPGRSDLSVSGAAVMGLASAANAGVFDLPPSKYDLALDGPDRLTRARLIDRAWDVAFHNLVVLTTKANWRSQVNPTGRRVDVGAYQPVTQRGAAGERYFRNDLMRPEAPSPRLVAYLYGSYSPASGWNLYTTASGGYVLLTSSNLLDRLLRTPADTALPADGRGSIGDVYPFDLTAAGGGPVWTGRAGTAAAGYEVSRGSGGRYTGIVVRSKGDDLGVDATVGAVVNQIATVLYEKLSYTPAGSAGSGRVAFTRTLTDATRAQIFQNDFNALAPGFCLFNITKFLLAAGYPDALGPVSWHADFQDMTAYFEDAGHTQYLDNLFAVLVVTRAYRPLFLTTKRR